MSGIDRSLAVAFVLRLHQGRQRLLVVGSAVSGEQEFQWLVLGESRRGQQ